MNRAQAPALAMLLAAGAGAVGLRPQPGGRVAALRDDRVPGQRRPGPEQRLAVRDQLERRPPLQRRLADGVQPEAGGGGSRSGPPELPEVERLPGGELRAPAYRPEAVLLLGRRQPQARRAELRRTRVRRQRSTSRPGTWLLPTKISTREAGPGQRAHRQLRRRHGAAADEVPGRLQPDHTRGQGRLRDLPRLPATSPRTAPYRGRSSAARRAGRHLAHVRRRRVPGCG